MSKPLFFTGRRQISRGAAIINLEERDGHPSRFRVQLDLSGHRLPANSTVVVEAYHNAYLERFPMGTVADSATERTHVLRDLEPGDRPLFRVKVISADPESTGRILAAIDEVRALTQDDSGSAKSLLPLIPKRRSEMGDEFWRVNFVLSDEREPELWVNRDVNGLFAAFQNNDPRIAALIMPEILRQVLLGLVGTGEPWSEDGIIGQWLSFASSFCPDEFEEWDDDDRESSERRRREWVDEVVRQFAAHHRFFDRYHEPVDGGTEDFDND